MPKKEDDFIDVIKSEPGPGAKVSFGAKMPLKEAYELLGADKPFRNFAGFKSVVNQLRKSTKKNETVVMMRAPDGAIYLRTTEILSQVKVSEGADDESNPEMLEDLLKKAAR